MHSSSEDDDMESPFPNDLSLQQVTSASTKRDKKKTREKTWASWLWNSPPTGLLRLSDPADDGQLCGPVRVQRWGVQRTRRKYQVSRDKKKKVASDRIQLFRFLHCNRVCKMPIYRQQKVAELCKITGHFGKVMKFERFPDELAEFMFWMFVVFYS